MVSVPPDENFPNDISSFLREALGLLPDDEIFVCPLMLRIIVLIDDDRITEVCRRRDAGSEITHQIRGWELVFITHVDLELKIDRSFGLFNQLDNSLWTWCEPISRGVVWKTLSRDVTRMAILFPFDGLTAWFGKIAFGVPVIQHNFKGFSPHSNDSVH
ncbi:MAG: hypothetical protein R3C17_02535 [Planctomycetaceae bacterium]